MDSARDPVPSKPSVGIMHLVPLHPPLLPFFTADGFFQIAEPEEHDLRSLFGHSIDRRQSHDLLTDWYLLAVHRLNRDATDVVVLGHSTARDRPWLSPPLIALDLKRGSAGASTGKRYRLGLRGLGEPPADLRDYLLCELGVEPVTEAR